jgi:hypothetical protein
MSLDQRLACTVSPDKRLHLRFKFISIIQQWCEFAEGGKQWVRWDCQFPACLLVSYDKEAHSNIPALMILLKCRLWRIRDWVATNLAIYLANKHTLPAFQLLATINIHHCTTPQRQPRQQAHHYHEEETSSQVTTKSSTKPTSEEKHKTGIGYITTLHARLDDNGCFHACW